MKGAGIAAALGTLAGGERNAMIHAANGNGLYHVLVRRVPPQAPGIVFRRLLKDGLSRQSMDIQPLPKRVLPYFWD